MVTTFLRFKDLKARGVVQSWPSLRYKIQHGGFPPGRYLGPNTRAWTVEEVEEWLASCPAHRPRKTSITSEAA